MSLFKNGVSHPMIYHHVSILIGNFRVFRCLDKIILSVYLKISHAKQWLESTAMLHAHCVSGRIVFTESFFVIHLSRIQTSTIPL